MTRWEYMTWTPEDSSWDDDEDYLNELGSHGWELVNFTIDDDGDAIYVLKRPLLPG